MAARNAESDQYDGQRKQLEFFGQGPPDFIQSTETVRFEKRHCHRMASLTAADTQRLEDILDIRSGYVLKFTDLTFGQLFDRYDIDIYSDRYETYGTSKGKRLRAFLEQGPDLLVGKVLFEMLGAYEAICDSKPHMMKPKIYEACCKIATRLCGKAPNADSAADGEFPDKEFEMPDVQKLPVDPAVVKIIQARLAEARACLRAGAYLSPIILWGSILEAVLLGATQQEQKRFYSSPSSPKKKDGGAKPLQEWSLMELINVASNVGLLKTDAQCFSQVLRDFRNYIHPAQQAKSGFAPDKHTAKLCLVAFKTALADVAGER